MRHIISVLLVEARSTQLQLGALPQASPPPRGRTWAASALQLVLSAPLLCPALRPPPAPFLRFSPLLLFFSISGILFNEVAQAQSSGAGSHTHLSACHSFGYPHGLWLSPRERCQGCRGLCGAAAKWQGPGITKTECCRGRAICG